VAGTRFYERREVKDIRRLPPPDPQSNDNISLLRIINVPGRGIGETTLGKLSAWADSAGCPSLRDAPSGIEQQEPDTTKTQPPFSRPVSQALTGFCHMMEELITRTARIWTW